MSNNERTKVTLEKVSPQKASEWLTNTEKSKFQNRPVSKTTVTRYAADMKHKHWNVDTVEPIKLCLVSGVEVVGDGQHRLTALIHSSTTLPFYVARYIPEAAFLHLDQGRSRTLEDLMSIKGWKNQRVLAGAGRDLWRLSATGNAGNRAKTEASEGTILDFLERHHYKLLDETFDVYEEYFSCINRDRIASKAWMLYLVYHWRQIDEKRCDRVLNYLADTEGEQAPTKEWAFAVKQIRRTRTQMIAGARKLQTTRGYDLRVYTMQMLSVAWNCDRRNKKFNDIVEFKKYIANSDNRGIPISI